MRTWRIAAGELLHDAVHEAFGYSGHDTCKNEPDACHIVGRGPIPPGWYDIGDPENHPDLGPLAMPLTPRPGTDTFGRSGFFIHGDSIGHPGAASHGCIILPRPVRAEIAASTDRALQVIP